MSEKLSEKSEKSKNSSHTDESTEKESACSTHITDNVLLSPDINKKGDSKGEGEANEVLETITFMQE